MKQEREDAGLETSQRKGRLPRNSSQPLNLQQRG